MERTPLSRDVLQFQAKVYLLKTFKNIASCLGGVYAASTEHWCISTSPHHCPKMIGDRDSRINQMVHLVATASVIHRRQEICRIIVFLSFF